MPSTTPAQQRLMGQAYAIKTGKMKPSDLNPEYKDQIVKLADSMTTKQLKDFAETKHSEMKEDMNEFLSTYEEFINDINEAADLKLSTWEEPRGVMNRFRLGSEAIRLRSVLNLSRESWTRSCSAFDDGEIGFENAKDRKEAMEFIEKAFKTNKLKFWEYELNESTNKTQEMEKLKSFSEFVNESLNEKIMDTKYWMTYNQDTSGGQVPKEHFKMEKNFQDAFEVAVTEWQKEAEERLTSAQIKNIEKLAMEFFKKEKQISVAIIQAMIMQES